jgi:hypothetical protein
MCDEKPAWKILVQCITHSSASIRVANVIDTLRLVVNDSERLNIFVGRCALVDQIRRDTLRRDDDVATRTGLGWYKCDAFDIGPQATCVTHLSKLNTGFRASGFGVVAPDAKWFFADEEVAGAFVSDAAFDLAARTTLEFAHERGLQGTVGSSGELVLKVLGFFVVDEEVLFASSRGAVVAGTVGFVVFWQRLFAPGNVAEIAGAVYFDKA